MMKYGGPMVIDRVFLFVCITGLQAILLGSIPVYRRGYEVVRFYGITW